MNIKITWTSQIVRGILNVLDISAGATIIDPFCGSGTTLVECSHGNINAVGWDLNPLAVYISNAKLQSLSIEVNEIKRDFLSNH